MATKDISNYFMFRQRKDSVWIPGKNKLSFNQNSILIIAKYFVFKSAKEKTWLNIIEFQNFFQKIYNEQMYLAKTNCEFEKFSRLWSMFSFCS